MHVTGTQISYYHTCHRELWLCANEIYMEHTSDLVAEGKLIGEIAYERRSERFKQLQLDGIKIDFFDPKERVIHETKRGRVIESAHRAQVQYYMYRLWQHGFGLVSGVIEYPDLRQTERVPPLTESDFQKIESWVAEAQQIMQSEQCPPVIRKPFCKNCSYYDLCYIDEVPT